MSYFNIFGLQNIYLEDSFVLAINESSEEIIFLMEFVLTKEHPEYSIPSEGEQYCYRKGKLSFKCCKKIKWSEKSLNQFFDKNKEVDLGNIDSFSVDEDVNFLEGDWGEVEIISDYVTIELE